MTELSYFAYGSNLEAGDFARWCAERGHRATLGSGRPAFLPDHRAVFGYASAVRAGGALDVRPCVGTAVPGALIAVDEAALRALDAKEGVLAGIYERVACHILCEGRVTDAFTYRVTAAHRAEYVAPADAYCQLALVGLDRLGLPAGPLRRAARGESYEFPSALFIYGTLMSGEERSDALDGRVRGRRRATVHGRLVHLGAWPGLRLPDGDSRRLDSPGSVPGSASVSGSVPTSAEVFGELVDLHPQGPDNTDRARLFAQLDEIEDFLGYGAPGSMYHRVVLPVACEGERCHAWTYVLVDDALASVPIPSGDWRRAPKRVVV